MEVESRAGVAGFELCAEWTASAHLLRCVFDDRRERSVLGHLHAARGGPRARSSDAWRADRVARGRVRVRVAAAAHMRYGSLGSEVSVTLNCTLATAAFADMAIERTRTHSRLSSSLDWTAHAEGRMHRCTEREKGRRAPRSIVPDWGPSPPNILNSHEAACTCT